MCLRPSADAVASKGRKAGTERGWRKARRNGCTTFAARPVPVTRAGAKTPAPGSDNSTEGNPPDRPSLTRTATGSLPLERVF